MTAVLQDLTKRFQFNSKFVGMLGEGFEPEHWSRKPSDDGGNSAHWILGHLVVSRRYIVRTLGGDAPDSDWEKEFGRGAQPEDTGGFPAPAELSAQLEQTDAELGRLLPEISEERAASNWSPQGGAFPDGSKSVLGALQFLHFHESYHLGQLGLIRRMCGLPGIA